MEWFTDRLTLISDAYRHRKALVTIAVAVCAFVGAFDPITEWIKARIIRPIPPAPPSGGATGGAMIFGISSWYLGVILLLLVFLVVVFEYALSLYRQLQPKFHMDFSTSTDVVLTPIEIHEIDPAGARIVTPSKGAYVRIRLISETKRIITGCHVFLTLIENQTIPTAPFASIPMYNSIRLTQNAIDILPRVPQPVDFLSSGERESILSLVGAYPLYLRDIFQRPGTYRFTILAISDNGGDREIKVDIDWSGKWDQIKGRKVS